MKWLIWSCILLIVVVSFIVGCKKADDSKPLGFNHPLYPSTPSVTTQCASDITTTTAVCGGIVSVYPGIPEITARGVCWGRSGLFDPTISDSKTTDGAGTGAYLSTLTSLIPGVKYYVRAYATNSTATYYGNTQNFITLAEIPRVTTTPF
jgi:hypothetical protein